MSQNIEYAKKLLLKVMKAIVESVKVGGQEGASGGILYLACMNLGISLDTFTQIMQQLVTDGYLLKKSDRYYWVKDLNG